MLAPITPMMSPQRRGLIGASSYIESPRLDDGLSSSSYQTLDSVVRSALDLARDWLAAARRASIAPAVAECELPSLLIAPGASAGALTIGTPTLGVPVRRTAGSLLCFSAGGAANLYRTDLTNLNVPHWREDGGAAFSTRTFGKTRILSSWAEARLFAAPLTFTLGARIEDWRAFDGGLGRIGTGAQAGQQVFNRYASRHESALDPKFSVEWANGAPVDDDVAILLLRST